MGFWSKFGKIASIAGPIAAAPFTGGGSLLGLLGASAPVATAIGTGLGVAGKLASGASAQRAVDRGAQAEYDTARVPVENAQALQFAQAKRQAEADRLRQVGGADMLSNFKAPSDPRAQKFLNNGQLGGGQINPETLELMRSRAMNALNSGSDVPQMQTMPAKPGGGATGMDSFLNALSMGSTALGGLREAGLLGGDDGGRAASVKAPADLSASIFDREEDVPWWSPLARKGN
jgi:hypothetical protein